MNNTIERRILQGFVSSKEYIDSVLPFFDKKYIVSSEGKLVISWCIKHYEKTHDAPKEDIQIYFDKWAAKKEDEEYVELLDILINSILQTKINNVSYIIIETKKYFELRSFKLLAENIDFAVSTDNVDEAKEHLVKFKKKQNVSDSDIWLLEEENEIINAFEQDVQPILKIGGRLGYMMNPHLIRGSFVVFMGHEKVGKTWQLIYFAMKAYQQRLNVVYFEAGDMSKSQFIRRIGMYITRGNYMKQYAGEQLVPVVDCLKNQNDSCDLQYRECKEYLLEDSGEKPSFEEAERRGYKPCTYCRNNRKLKDNFVPATWFQKQEIPLIDASSVLDKAKFWLKKVSRNRRFKFVSYPTGTLSVNEISLMLEKWRDKDNFIPDVICIDYADILKRGGKDERESIRQNWADLRALSIEQNVLLISATQADAGSYGKFLLDMKNFSEDKRKFAFVTAMFGLNQTQKDKLQKVMRYNTVVVREGSDVSSSYVTVLQSLAQGRAIIDNF
jgi:hypothetical protein